jgi:hypothetical protein
VDGGTGRLCVNEPNTSGCDDGDDCTDPDTCEDGACVAGDFVCECTEDGDCESHEDGNLCNGTYFCDTDGYCKIDPATVVECDPSDDTDCNRNLCDPDTGTCSMTDMPDGTACEDDDPCNDPDTCDGSGTCTGTDTGLSDCGGECVDLMTDHDHCGHCFDPCAFDEACVEGECEELDWTAVGGGLAGTSRSALAQAISTNGADPFVAMILASSSMSKPVEVYRWASGAWNHEAGLASTSEGSEAAIDLDFYGSDPHIIFTHRVMADPSTTIRLLRCQSDLATCDDERYETACLSNHSLRMDLDRADAHFATVGAGGCGIGVGYAWYEQPSDAFYEHPGTMLGDGLLPWEGRGDSGIVYTDQAYVGILANNFSSDPPTPIYVVFWDSSATTWTPLDGDLSVHAGECFGGGGPGDSPCAIDLTANASGTIYAAWTENRDPNTRFVYVKRHDGTGWTQLGGPLNDFSDGGHGNGANPVIHLMGGDVFVAYQDFAGTNYQIFVKRWNGTAWDQVGPELNTVVTANAYEPDMTSIGRSLYVSFLEERGLSDREVYVKRFP